MIESVAPLIEIAKLNRRLFPNSTEGLDDAAAARRPNGRTNNVVFLAAHVVDARYYLTGLIGGVLSNPFGASLAKVRNVEDMSDPPSMSDIASAWGPVSDDLVARLEALTVEQALRPEAIRFPSRIGLRSEVRRFSCSTSRITSDKLRCSGSTSVSSRCNTVECLRRNRPAAIQRRQSSMPPVTRSSPRSRRPRALFPPEGVPRRSWRNAPRPGRWTRERDSAARFAGVWPVHCRGSRRRR